MFLELPAELRLDIYKRILLIPSCPAVDPKPSSCFPHIPTPRNQLNFTEGRLVIHSGTFIIDPVHQRPFLQLQILQCCRQLCKEGRDYFWNQNKIEQHNQLCFPYLHISCHFNSIWPQHGMHLPSIRVLRVAIISADVINPTMRFSCSSLETLPNLEVLQVAFIYTNGSTGDWRSDGQNKYWTDTLMLGAVVRRLVQHTPPQVTLRWGLWDEALGDRDIKLGRSISIHRRILEKVAKSYKRERGRKVRLAVKKEARS